MAIESRTCVSQILDSFQYRSVECGLISGGTGRQSCSTPAARCPSDGSASGCPAGGGRTTAQHRGRDRRGRAVRDRRDLASGGVRRAFDRHRQGHHPAHPARRVLGALRGPSRRQPPSSHLPNVRPDGRCRLCRRRGAVPHCGRGLGLRDRRSRGHLLGSLCGVPDPDPKVNPVDRPTRPCRSRRRNAGMEVPNTPSMSIHSEGHSGAWQPHCSQRGQHGRREHMPGRAPRPDATHYG
jgi:hypothetical protein